jgi:uncharacterized protein (TIGR02246 family)
MSREAMAAVNRRFEEATRKGDVDGMAAVYTEDGVAMPPDGPVIQGRDAVREMWGSVLKDMGLRDVKLETLDLEINGDTACEVGKATLNVEPPGGEPATAVAKFVVYWKKDGDTWKWHRDIWNNMPS